MELGVGRLRAHCNTFAENQLQRIPIDPFSGISLSTASYFSIGDRDSILGGPRPFFKLPDTVRVSTTQLIAESRLPCVK